MKLHSCVYSDTFRSYFCRMLNGSVSQPRNSLAHYTIFVAFFWKKFTVCTVITLHMEILHYIFSLPHCIWMTWNLHTLSASSKLLYLFSLGLYHILVTYFYIFSAFLIVYSSYMHILCCVYIVHSWCIFCTHTLFFT